MSECREIYVDQMSVMSIGNGGTIAKLVFVSNVTEMSGAVSCESRLVVTMPVNQLKRMLQEIQNAGIDQPTPPPAALRSPRRTRASN